MRSAPVKSANHMADPQSQAKVVPGLALCLSSSFLGHYAHSGLLCRLEAAGVIPERISGCSAGAIAGGLFAAGVRGGDLRRLVTSVRFKRAFADFGFALRVPGVLTGLYATGALSGRRMRRFLRKRLGDPQIEDLRDPALELAVTNLTDCRPEVVSRGPLIDFLIASFSMPIVFTPQRIDGKLYLDGGIANEAPFGQWLDDDSVDTIVVHSINHDADGWREPRSVPAVLAQSHGVVAAHITGELRARARRSGKRALFLETEHCHPGIFQGRRARDYFNAGSRTAESLLRSLDGAKRPSDLMPKPAILKPGA